MDVLNGQTGPDISGVIQDELMDMYMSCVNPPGVGGIPPGGRRNSESTGTNIQPVSRTIIKLNLF